jgi:hypothetical protein
MATSKTARRSTPTGPAGKFQPDSSASRIMPLAGGTAAYILNATDGGLDRFEVESDGFRTALAELATAIGVERVRRDLTAAASFVPAWSTLAENLEAIITPTEAEPVES